MKQYDRDDERGRCAWTDGRERCHYPGAISHGTRGEGPWYCSWHFNCSDGVTGQRVIEQSRGFTPGEDVPRRVATAAPRPSFTFTAPPAAARLPYVDRDDAPVLEQAEPGANG